MRERHFFRSFQSYVFDYENFSDDEINALVVAGMAYRDDEILMNVLAGIAYEAMEALSNDGTPNRNIDAIPGFKEQLISLIRAGLEDDSWIEAKIIPPWWLGYIPLAVYFSTDTDVENLIVDTFRRGGLPRIFYHRWVPFGAGPVSTLHIPASRRSECSFKSRARD